MSQKEPAANQETRVTVKLLYRSPGARRENRLLVYLGRTIFLIFVMVFVAGAITFLSSLGTLLDRARSP